MNGDISEYIYDFGVYLSNDCCFGTQNDVCDSCDGFFSLGNEDGSGEIVNDFYQDKDNSLFLERINEANTGVDASNYSENISSYLSSYSAYSSVFPINSSFNRCDNKSDNDGKKNQDNNDFFEYEFRNPKSKLLEDSFTSEEKEVAVNGSNGAFKSENSVTNSVCDGEGSRDLVTEPRHFEDEYYKFILGDNSFMDNDQNSELKEISFNLSNPTNNNINDGFLVSLLRKLKHTIDSDDVNQLNIHCESEVNDSNDT